MRLGLVETLAAAVSLFLCYSVDVHADGAGAQPGPVGVVAHRGFWNCEAGGYARNSFAAFKAAGEAGFWGTEFDINMTADGHLLVFHDDNINGKRIDKNPVSAFADYRLENGEPIPELDQFLEYASSQKNFPKLVFELKWHSTPELEERAVSRSVETLKKYRMFDPDKVMFISFSIRQCRLLAEAAPGFTVQYLNSNLSIDQLLDNDVNGIDMYWETLYANQSWIDLCRQFGFSVNCWTVDKEEDIRKMVGIGIDQITTDNPDRARRVLAESGIPEMLNENASHAKVKSPVLKKHISACDYVLCYAGGEQAKNFDKDWMRDYVSYTDRDGMEHWLFDGFLFLQIRDFGSKVAFDPGHKDIDGSLLQSATQADWQRLIDYYFQEGHCFSALDQAVEEAKSRIGDPGYKRQVIVSIPNPIPFKNPVVNTGGTQYWGLLDGKVADFSSDLDRLAACKWFVSNVLKRWKQQKYSNLELVGFYFITEEASRNGTLIPALSDYLHSIHYPFTWIPYYSASGWNLWKEKGFDYVWYQPNYFFNENIPESRLASACTRARNYGMAMEMEFDERVLADRKDCMAYRLRDYMQAFKKFGSWENLPIAYYQSGSAVRTLKLSSNPEDHDLYQDFCDFVAKRPYRSKVKTSAKH